jgi:hypothetical protein
MQVVLNVCDAADLVVTGTMDVRSPSTIAETAHAVRFVHSRTALARAAARRNLASTLLLDAVGTLTGAPISAREPGQSAAERASAADAAAAAFGGAALSLSLISQAQANVTQALEQVNTALTRISDLSLSTKSPSSPSRAPASALTADGGGAGGGATGSVEAAAALSRPAWTHLLIDLRLMRADLASSAAELGLLTALFAVWQPLPAQSTAACAAPLFPLSADLAEVAEPVLRTVSSAAEAALSEGELLEASRAAGAASSDHGFGGAGGGMGVAQPLALLAQLQLLGGKAVTAEGLLRAVIDKTSEAAQRVPSSPPRGAGVSPPVGTGAGSATVVAGGGIDLASDVARWRAALLPQQLAQAASVLHLYGELLSQWDKREGEAVRVAALAAQLFRDAARPLGLAPPAQFAVAGTDASAGAGAGAGVGAGESGAGEGKRSGVVDRRLDFLAARIFSCALTTAHVGSVSGGLLLDWASV